MRAAAVLQAAVLAALAAVTAATPLCWDANHTPYPAGAGVTVAGAASETLTLGTNNAATDDPLMPAMHCEWRVCPEAPGDVLAVQAQFAVLGPGGSLEVTVELGDGQAPQHHTLWEAGTAKLDVGDLDPDSMFGASTANWSYTESELILATADPAATFYAHGCVRLVARTGALTTADVLEEHVSAYMRGSAPSGGCSSFACGDRWGKASGFSVTFEAVSGCKPGTISDGAGACQNCPAGQTSVGVDATECVACSTEGGVFCAGAGLPEQSCPPGTFSPAGAAPAACQACGASTTSLHGETACRPCGNNADCHELDFGGLYRGGFKTTGYHDGLAAATKMSADGLTMVVTGPGVGAGAWIYTRAEVGDRFERAAMLEMLAEPSLADGLNAAAKWGSSLLATAVDVDMSPDGSLVCASVQYGVGSGDNFTEFESRGYLAGVNAAYAFERPGASWGTGVSVAGTLLEATGLETNHTIQRFGAMCRVAGTDRVLVSDPGYGELFDTRVELVSDSVGALFVFRNDGSSWVQAQMLKTPRSEDASSYGLRPNFGVFFAVGAAGDYMMANAQTGGALPYKWNGGTNEYDLLGTTDGIKTLGENERMGSSFYNGYRGLLSLGPRSISGPIVDPADARGGLANTVFALSGDAQYFVTRITSFVDDWDGATEKQVEVYKRTGDAWALDATLDVTASPTSVASINHDGSRIVLLLDACPLNPSDLVDGSSEFTCTTGFGSKAVFQRTGAAWAEYATLSTDAGKPHVNESVPSAATGQQGSSSDMSSVVSVQHTLLETGTIPSWDFDFDFLALAVAVGPQSTNKMWFAGRRAVSARPVVYDLCRPGTSCTATSGSATACPAGSYCTGGTAPAQACGSGKYCPARSATEEDCAAGSYCADATSQVACAAGKYCPAGSTTEDDCAAGSYCPGAVEQRACAAGKYCPAGSATEEDCPAGSYCADATLQVACAAGKYCPAGSTTEDDCATGSFCATTTSQEACADGKYCPAGSTSGDTDCAAGSYCATPASQVACAAGKYCLAGSTTEADCAAGSYCATTTSQVACAAGKYCLAGSTTEEDCAAGSYCATTTSQVPCAAGKYCPAGSTTEEDCAAGSYCATTTSQVACAAGKYCPAGSTTEEDCPAGSFCADAATRANCATAGAYCPAGSVNETLCEAGFFCANTTSKEQCPAGSECPAGSTAAVKCELRSFASAAGSAACTECGAEQVPNAQLGAVACGECPDGSEANEDFTECEEGSPASVAAASAASTVAALLLAVVAGVFAV